MSVGHGPDPSNGCLRGGNLTYGCPCGGDPSVRGAQPTSTLRARPHPSGHVTLRLSTSSFVARRAPSPSSTSCVQTKLAASRPALLTRTSHTCVRRPRCSGSPTAISSSPTTPALSTLTFSSAVVNVPPGGRLRIVPQAATVSANATHTPPCTYPNGCRWR